MKSCFRIEYFFLLLFCCCGSPSLINHADSIKGKPNGNGTGEKVVGGPCDQCETLFEGMPALNRIGWETTLAGANEPGERLELSGKVFMRDGKSPAADIVLYFHHTDAKGFYSPGDTQTVARKDGHLRGWIKTNAQGEFKLHTIRPAPYPNRTDPAHIHILVKEPGKTLYYIDEVWFDDDPFITKELKDKSELRGGNMIIHLSKNEKDEWTGQLNIVAGFNIPGYN